MMTQPLMDADSVVPRCAVIAPPERKMELTVAWVAPMKTDTSRLRNVALLA